MFLFAKIEAKIEPETVYFVAFQFRRKMNDPITDSRVSGHSKKTVDIHMTSCSKHVT